MSDTPRKKPYLWVTWITKLLAGEDRCWFKAWWKVHHKYEKTPDDADRAQFFEEWTARHDTLVRRRAEQLRSDNYVTRLEDAGEFKLIGKAVDVSGKPDIVGIRDLEALVVDAKSGKKRQSDHWQVLIYMFALPLSWLTGFKVRGEVAYSDGNERVRDLGSAERTAIVDAINRVGSHLVPKATPSPKECQFCDVASCEYRYDRAQESGDASEYF